MKKRLFFFMFFLFVFPLVTAVPQGYSCGYLADGSPFCDEGLECENFECVLNPDVSYCLYGNLKILPGDPVCIDDMMIECNDIGGYLWITVYDDHPCGSEDYNCGTYGGEYCDGDELCDGSWTISSEGSRCCIGDCYNFVPDDYNYCDYRVCSEGFFCDEEAQACISINEADCGFLGLGCFFGLLFGDIGSFLGDSIGAVLGAGAGNFVETFAETLWNNYGIFVILAVILIFYILLRKIIKRVVGIIPFIGKPISNFLP